MNGDVIQMVPTTIEGKAVEVPPQKAAPVAAEKKRIAIVGMGASIVDYVAAYVNEIRSDVLADEVWVINNCAQFLKHDMVISMRDLRSAEPDDPMLLDLFKKSPVPVMTTKKYPEYPTSFEFPLVDVLNKYQAPYMNNSVAYAVAYAMWRGDVKHISLFGCDYTYPNRSFAEEGRGCLEFWLSKAMNVGIAVTVATSSTLLDQAKNRTYYGYKEAPQLAVEDGRFRLVDGSLQEKVKKLNEAVAELNRQTQVAAQFAINAEQTRALVANLTERYDRARGHVGIAENKSMRAAERARLSKMNTLIDNPAPQLLEIYANDQKIADECAAEVKATHQAIETLARELAIAQAEFHHKMERTGFEQGRMQVAQNVVFNAQIAAAMTAGGEASRVEASQTAAE